MSSHRYSRHRRSKSRRWLVPVLYLALFLMFIALFVMAINLQISRKEMADLSALQRKHERRLAEVEPRIRQLEMENAALVQSRFPGLEPLEVDRVIPLNRAYVKNIIFSLAGKGENKLYEYRVVLDNREGRIVSPDVEIFLFDHNGIQVGASYLKMRGKGDGSLKPLAERETRSHAGPMSLDRDAEPAYFLVNVRN